jgi:hypothetical protein
VVSVAELSLNSINFVSHVFFSFVRPLFNHKPDFVAWMAAQQPLDETQI